MSEAFDIGHNQPESALLAELTQDNEALAERRDELLESQKRAPDVIENEGHKKGCIDLTKLLKAVKKEAVARNKTAKAPILEDGKTVDNFFKRGFSEPVDVAARSLENRIGAYDQKLAAEERRRRDEEARIAREEAAKREAGAKTDEDLEAAIEADEQAQDAQAATQASDADLTRTRGETGAVSSSTSKWVGEIVSVEKLDLETLRGFIPTDALDKAVKAFVRNGGRKLDGAHIHETFKTVVR